MEKTIKQILEKVKLIAKYNGDMRPVNESKPEITIREKDNDLVISSITYSWYDIILVCETGIFLIPEHGQRKTLFSYKNWDGLLNL